MAWLLHMALIEQLWPIINFCASFCAEWLEASYMIFNSSIIFISSFADVNEIIDYIIDITTTVHL